MIRSKCNSEWHRDNNLYYSANVINEVILVSEKSEHSSWVSPKMIRKMIKNTCKEMHCMQTWGEGCCKYSLYSTWEHTSFFATMYVFRYYLEACRHASFILAHIYSRLSRVTCGGMMLIILCKRELYFRQACGPGVHTVGSTNVYHTLRCEMLACLVMHVTKIYLCLCL